MKFFREKESAQPIEPETKLTTEEFDQEIADFRRRLLTSSARERIGDFLRVVAIGSSLGIGVEAVRESAESQQEIKARMPDVAETTAATISPELDVEVGRKFLEKKLGVGFLATLDMIIANTSDEATEEILEPEWQVYNFEKLGISDDMLRRIIYETLPQEWIHGNVSFIAYSDQEVEAAESYNLKIETLAVCSNRDGKNLAEITFGKAAITQTLDYIIGKSIPHELAHAVDMFGHAKLSNEQRVSFFVRLIKSLESKSHTIFPYVEEDINNENKKTELLNKIIEYWAMIFETYLYDPVASEQILSFDEHGIVVDFLKLTAPDFNPYLSAEQRRAMILKLESQLMSVAP